MASFFCAITSLLLLVAPFFTVAGEASVALAQAGSKGVLGVIEPTFTCGGVGESRELRITNCTGVCQFRPATPYDCELDFMPNQATPSLSLAVDICTHEGCVTIFSIVVPGSSVQPGFVYTVRYRIVPNDILAGQRVQFRAFIFQTATQLVEVCIGANVDVLELE